MICTFFGHRDTLFSLKDEIKKAIMDLIEKASKKGLMVINLADN